MGPLKNSRHESFVCAIFAGQNARQAYRAAISTTCTDNAADSAASTLLKQPKVAARLEELKGTVVSGVVLTKEWLVGQMIDVAAQAAADRAHAPRTRALELLGREKGTFTEQKNVTVTSLDTMSLEQLEDMLAQLAASNAPQAGSGPKGGNSEKAPRDRKSRRA